MRGRPTEDTLDERLKQLLMDKTLKERLAMLIIAAKNHGGMSEVEAKRYYNKVKKRESRARMLTHKPDADRLRPNTDMVGTCRVCGTVVRAKRVDCRQGDLELLYAECPTCKARSPRKAGGAVEMRAEPQGPEKPT